MPNLETLESIRRWTDELIKKIHDPTYSDAQIHPMLVGCVTGIIRQHYNTLEQSSRGQACPMHNAMVFRGSADTRTICPEQLQRIKDALREAGREMPQLVLKLLEGSGYSLQPTKKD